MTKEYEQIKEKIAKRIADSRCEVCNNCGASISTDNPDEVADQILNSKELARYFRKGYVELAEVTATLAIILKEPVEAETVKRLVSDYLQTLRDKAGFVKAIEEGAKLLPFATPYQERHVITQTQLDQDKQEIKEIFDEADRLFAMLLCASSSVEYDEVRNLWQAFKKEYLK